ncbi:MAG: (2Fe-2S)-binding protein [Acidobacteria bacterium]|nr:(2Fe-2S)-binding protein [Acidobacteriota bacterium]
MDSEDHGKKHPGKKGFSRRSFLQGIGISGGAVASLPKGLLAEPQAESGARVMGPGPVPVSLRINGKVHNLNIEPRVTLLDALRNHLDLTGAKKVCDRSVCGTCTVIVAGHPVYACGLLAIEAQGKDIQTIEGLLSTHGKAHPVPTAFVENDAQQCGFCTPGFVMAVKAFLDKHPNPTMEQVKQGLGGNLCRCGTYIGVRQAALDAAREMRGGKRA